MDITFSFIAGFVAGVAAVIAVMKLIVYMVDGDDDYYEEGDI